MRTKTKCVIAKQLFIALLVLISFQSFADQKEIVFGVVPQQSASKLAKQWGPLLEAWSDVTGIKFRFATARDIPTFEERLAAGEYDMAYMNPYHFTLVNHAAGYTALAHAMTEERERSFASGMNDHLSKPISKDLLIKMIFKWLSLSEENEKKQGAKFKY